MLRSLLAAFDSGTLQQHADPFAGLILRPGEIAAAV